VGTDEDQDCFSNRADNCPLVNQLDDPNSPPSANNKPKNTDKDSDGIGDACDPHPDIPDGDYVSMCLSYPITIGAGASTQPAPATKADGPQCVLAPGTTPAPTATVPGQTPGPTGARGGGGGGGGGGIGGPGSSGVGSLAPTGTSVSLLAVLAAAAGAIGVAAGLGVLGARRARRRD
jgi:hypothetical protein